MPFTEKALGAEVHAWIKDDGSKVGRITSSAPLALNMHLMKVVWQGIQSMVENPTIIYVCNTTLQAELLNRELKDISFHGGKIGEKSVVSQWSQDVGGVVLLSYARFRELLDAEARAPFLHCHLVVICEQEPGSNMDAVVARGQFALIAREALVRQPGCNLKLLRLSYRQDRGKDWLKHAVHLMSTSPLVLSLDQTVSCTEGAPLIKDSMAAVDNRQRERLRDSQASQYEAAHVRSGGLLGINLEARDINSFVARAVSTLPQGTLYDVRITPVVSVEDGAASSEKTKDRFYN